MYYSDCCISIQFLVTCNVLNQLTSENLSLTSDMAIVDDKNYDGRDIDNNDGH